MVCVCEEGERVHMYTSFASFHLYTVYHRCMLYTLKRILGFSCDFWNWLSVHFTMLMLLPCTVMFSDLKYKTDAQDPVIFLMPLISFSRENLFLPWHWAEQDWQWVLQVRALGQQQPGEMRALFPWHPGAMCMWHWLQTDGLITPHLHQPTRREKRIWHLEPRTTLLYQR